MKGLLLKDFYMTWRYLKAFLLMIVCFAVGGGFQAGNMSDFLTVYPCVMAALSTVSLLAYDEREKWNVYCEAMPVARAQYVTEKYLYALCVTFSVLVFHALGMLLGLAAGRGVAVDGLLPRLALLFPASLLGQAVIFPFLFRLGAEKGRLAYALLFGLLFAGLAVFPMLRRAGGSLPWVRDSGGGAVSALVCALSLALYAASWRLSVALYRKREL